MLNALIFDFDGVIVDTEPMHYRAFQRLLEPLGLGYSWDDYVAYYMGMDDREAFTEAFRSGGREMTGEVLGRLIDGKASSFLGLIEEGVTPYPGVVELVSGLAGRLPLALCSGALPSDIYPILERLGLARKFDVVVTAADVEASKPDPASYALCVNRLASLFPLLAITPGSCLAIEDTPAGITSARSAGIAVLAVTNSYPAERLSDASRIVDSLEELSIESLSEIVP